MNYKEILQEAIPLIKEWINKQQNNKEIAKTKCFQELVRVIKEIEEEEDYSKDSFDDIRFLLRTIGKSLSLKLKRLFNIATLDNYSAFIASRYFETTSDFIHFEMSTPKFQGNVNKFYYNPIPLNKHELKIFPNIKTYHIYRKEDSYETGGKIVRYEDWTKKKLLYD